MVTAVASAVYRDIYWCMVIFTDAGPVGASVLPTMCSSDVDDVILSL